MKALKVRQIGSHVDRKFIVKDPKKIKFWKMVAENCVLGLVLTYVKEVEI